MPYSPHQTSSPSHLLEIHSIGNISSSAAHISSPLWVEQRSSSCILPKFPNYQQPCLARGEIIQLDRAPLLWDKIKPVWTIMNLKQAWNYVFYQNSRSKASAGQGTSSAGEVIFNIFTFSTASPSGTYSTIPANWWMWPSTDQSIFPFSSRRLPSWIISSLTWYSQSWVCEFNWIFFLIHVWNELIDFCDFFIMFPCRDLSVSLPPPPNSSLFLLH